MNQLLPFKLGDETYAIEVTDIQEVVENQPIFPVPGAPETIAGAIGFHGRIVPVVDLPQLLGFSAGPRAKRILVLTDGHGPVALTVDMVRRIISVDLANATLTQSQSEQNCIHGVLNWREEMISLLDLEQLWLLMETLYSRTGGDVGKDRIDR